MEVTILGSGASLLSPDRVLSGLMIETAGEPLIFDMGAGVLHRLSCSLVELTRIEHLFISHLHVDHCSDIVALVQSLWLMGYDKTLNVYGPKAILKMGEAIGEMFPYLIGKIKIKSHTISPEFQVKSKNWTVRAFPVNHGDFEAYGYHLEAEGKRIVYSGDTAPSQELVKVAKGADLLIHECSLPDRMKGMAPNHSTPGEVGKVATDAGVKTLVITHLYPELIEELGDALRSIRATFSGKIIVPRDTQIITL
ncbi:MAG: MBL fold metallo-hydrolase [Candidatus Hermodarchaeota archaeon]